MKILPHQVATIIAIFFSTIKLSGPIRFKRSVDSRDDLARMFPAFFKFNNVTTNGARNENNIVNLINDDQIQTLLNSLQRNKLREIKSAASEASKAHQRLAKPRRVTSTQRSLNDNDEIDQLVKLITNQLPNRRSQKWPSQPPKRKPSSTAPPILLENLEIFRIPSEILLQKLSTTTTTTKQPRKYLTFDNIIFPEDISGQSPSQSPKYAIVKVKQESEPRKKPQPAGPSQVEIIPAIAHSSEWQDLIVPPATTLTPDIAQKMPPHSSYRLKNDSKSIMIIKSIELEPPNQERTTPTSVYYNPHQGFHYPNGTRATLEQALGLPMTEAQKKAKAQRDRGAWGSMGRPPSPPPPYFRAPALANAPSISSYMPISVEFKPPHPVGGPPPPDWNPLRLGRNNQNSGYYAVNKQGWGGSPSPSENPSNNARPQQPEAVWHDYPNNNAPEKPLNVPNSPMSNNGWNADEANRPPPPPNSPSQAPSQQQPQKGWNNQPQRPPSHGAPGQPWNNPPNPLENQLSQTSPQNEWINPPHQPENPPTEGPRNQQKQEVSNNWNPPPGHGSPQTPPFNSQWNSPNWPPQNQGVPPAMSYQNFGYQPGPPPPSWRSPPGPPQPPQWNQQAAEMNTFSVQFGPNNNGGYNNGPMQQQFGPSMNNNRPMQQQHGPSMSNNRPMQQQYGPSMSNNGPMPHWGQNNGGGSFQHDRDSGEQRYPDPFFQVQDNSNEEYEHAERPGENIYYGNYSPGQPQAYQKEYPKYKKPKDQKDKGKKSKSSKKYKGKKGKKASKKGKYEADEGGGWDSSNGWETENNGGWGSNNDGWGENEDGWGWGDKGDDEKEDKKDKKDKKKKKKGEWLEKIKEVFKAKKAEKAKEKEKDKGDDESWMATGSEYADHYKQKASELWDKAKDTVKDHFDDKDKKGWKSKPSFYSITQKVYGITISVLALVAFFAYIVALLFQTAVTTLSAPLLEGIIGFAMGDGGAALFQALLGFQPGGRSLQDSCAGKDAMLDELECKVSVAFTAVRRFSSRIGK